MGKKEGNKKGSTPTSGYIQGAVREEIKGRGSTDANSILKLQHLQKLASWAGREASNPHLAAFYGNRLAANREVLGIPPLDSSLISCQRCETILHPGYNCTIRIQKNRSKARRKKTKIPLANNMVYTCHFCSHQNLKIGTAKGYLKELITSRKRAETKANSIENAPATPSDKPGHSEVKADGFTELSAGTNKSSIVNTPATPIGKTCMVLSKKKKKKKRNKSQLSSLYSGTDNSEFTFANSAEMSSVMKTTSIENSPATPIIGERKIQLGSTNMVNNSGTGKLGKSLDQSRKRRRKSWSSLKEVAGIESDGVSRDFKNRTNRIDSSLIFG